MYYPWPSLQNATALVDTPIDKYIHKLYVMHLEDTYIDSQLPNKGRKPTLATTLPGTLQYTGPLYGLLTTLRMKDGFRQRSCSLNL